MNYQLIDLDTWSRKETFHHYLHEVPCSYDFSVKLDITTLIQNKARIYPSMLYCLTKIVNQHVQFRTAFRDNGALVCYTQMAPAYTIFHKATETFSTIWTDFHENYPLFLQNYQKEIETFHQLKQPFQKSVIPENTINISMIPWLNFESFHLNLSDSHYLLPIFTLGKYYQEQHKFFIPLAVHVHHSVCDGYHAGKFIEDLQHELDDWSFEQTVL